MDVSDTKRIVILGKTGAGKSSLANTIFGGELFAIGDTSNSETKKCKAETRSVNGRSITLIDTPGFFDTERSEEELKAEIVRCITECSPGPHAFLIVLKVETFTEQEQALINKIKDYFSEEVFKYTTVLFTHGDQLREGQTIMDFGKKNKLLNELVEKCGGRCHVTDNKYWNKTPKDDYRSNQFQVKELLNTVDKITEANRGGYYTNADIQALEEEIQQEEELIRQSSPNMSEEKIREQAKVSTAKKMLIRLAGIATGALLGALFGLVQSSGLLLKALKSGAKGKGGVVVIAGVAATAAVVGALSGGLQGYSVAEKAHTPLEAAKKVAKIVKDESPSTSGEEKYALEGSNRFKTKQSKPFIRQRTTSGNFSGHPNGVSRPLPEVLELHEFLRLISEDQVTDSDTMVSEHSV